MCMWVREDGYARVRMCLCVCKVSAFVYVWVCVCIVTAFCYQEPLPAREFYNLEGKQNAVTMHTHSYNHKRSNFAYTQTDSRPCIPILTHPHTHMLVQAHIYPFSHLPSILTLVHLNTSPHTHTHTHTQISFNSIVIRYY